MRTEEHGTREIHLVLTEDEAIKLCKWSAKHEHGSTIFNNGRGSNIQRAMPKDIQERAHYEG